MTYANGLALPAGRTWSIVTTTGEAMTGFLPAWAEEDPSRAGVEPGRLSVELSDVTHEAWFGGRLMRVCPGGQDPGEDSAVLGAVLRCRPFAGGSDAAARTPLVGIQIVDDFWIEDLDPSGVVEVAGRFRAFAELLVTEVAPALTRARAEWAEHLTAREPQAQV